jgi:hypothetical protein
VSFFLTFLFKPLKGLRETFAILRVDPLDAVLPLDKARACNLLGKRHTVELPPPLTRRGSVAALPSDRIGRTAENLKSGDLAGITGGI